MTREAVFQKHYEDGMRIAASLGIPDKEKVATVYAEKMQQHDDKAIGFLMGKLNKELGNRDADPSVKADMLRATLYASTSDATV